MPEWESCRTPLPSLAPSAESRCCPLLLERVLTGASCGIEVTICGVSLPSTRHSLACGRGCSTYAHESMGCRVHVAARARDSCEEQGLGRHGLSRLEQAKHLLSGPKDSKDSKILKGDTRPRPELHHWLLESWAKMMSAEGTHLLKRTSGSTCRMIEQSQHLCASSWLSRCSSQFLISILRSLAHEPQTVWFLPG